MRGAPLEGTLSFLLPGPAETALLGVCLRPRRAREAWGDWCRRGGDLDFYRSLLPLIDEGARRGGLELDEALSARLSGARLHESLRLHAIREIAAEVLDRLAGAGLDPVVVQDVALAETVYPEPALRHCHALELLLAPESVTVAASALEAGGFLRARERSTAAGSELAHESGFPVRLATAPLPRVVPQTDGSALGARAILTEIAGRRARVPAPADTLALVLGRAAVTAERRSLLWACDATLAIEAASDLDWDGVARVAAGWGLGIPLAAMLEWLSSELEAPVPRPLIERIAGTALQGAGRARATETALECVRADGRAGPATLLAHATSWRERASFLRWTAFPSIDRLRRSYPDVPRPALSLLYVARPLLGALRSVTGRSGRPVRARGSRAPEVGTAAARSGDRSGPAADRASASRRSSG